MFTRTVLATFVAGTVFGAGITSIGAAFKGSAVFKDVSSTHYADDAIGEMYQLGIIKGLDSTRFGPDEPITRGQVAILLQRLRNEMKGISNSSSSVSSRSSSSSSSSSSSVSSSSSSTSSSSSSYNPGGSVRFDSDEYNVEKNVATGNLSVAIVRIGGNQGSGTVEYTMTGGTAVAGQDYTLTQGTLTFGSKETSKKISIPIKNNVSVSGTRTVSLILRNPTGTIVLGNPPTAVINIVDPNAPSSSAGASSSANTTDAVLSFSATAYGVNENGGSLSINVVRTGVTTNAVSINFSTNGGTASSGSDFTPVTGTLSFAAGETVKNFVVAVSDNNSIEGNRSFSVILSNPTTGAIMGTNAATVTINDNESVGVSGSGSVKFSASTYNVTESQGKAIITVSHLLSLKPFSVNYATSQGSAIAPSDFTQVTGTLTFAVGETSKTFEVPIAQDSLSEEQETVNLSLSNPTAGVTLSDPSFASLRIND